MPVFTVKTTCCYYGVNSNSRLLIDLHLATGQVGKAGAGPFNPHYSSEQAA
jgi:anaerobic selenocysteine-containing dehydrogenase